MEYVAVAPVRERGLKWPKPDTGSGTRQSLP